jgi:hypothetical protein
VERVSLIRGERVVATVRREGAFADLRTEHGDRLAVTILDLTDTSHALNKLCRTVRRCVVEVGRLGQEKGQTDFGLELGRKRASCPSGHELETAPGANTSHRTGLTRSGHHGFYLSHKVP